METKVEIVLNYDFDPKEGYTEKTMILDDAQISCFEDTLRFERRIKLNLYEDDLKDLLQGTGIDINGN